MELINCQYTWILEHFSYKGLGNDSCPIRSPSFWSSECQGMKWFMKFPNDNDHTSLYLCRAEWPLGSVPVTFEMSLKNKDKEKTRKFEVTKPIPFQPGGSMKFNEDFLLGYLCDSAHGFLINDALVVECSITALIDSKLITRGKIEVNDLSLPQDYKNLLDNPVFSDVTLIVGNKEFKAHKCVLAARSEVFAAMFTHDTAENSKNQVFIKEIDQEVFFKALIYIYTGEVQDLDSVAVELLVVADMYKLQGLKSLCEKSINSKTSLSNALQTLAFAHKYSAHRLKTELIKYCADNLKELMVREEYEEFESSCSDLLAELLHEHVGIKKTLNQKGS